jgi:hypothetical protein
MKGCKEDGDKWGVYKSDPDTLLCTNSIVQHCFCIASPFRHLTVTGYTLLLLLGTIRQQYHKKNNIYKGSVRS